ncbi:MAG TPA: PAS domain-containing protein, partial [Alphaproteobacteria bacterium]|nr:PAS domain-containing protein [Alphaproteobacteria bacterium]
PTRGDFDLPDLQPWFGDLLIADVLHDVNDFRFRLFGTHVAEGIGRDLTGRRLSESGGLGEHTPNLHRALTKAVEGPAAVATQGSLYWQDRRYLRFAALYLPLGDAAGGVGQILGHCTFTFAQEEQGRRPLPAAGGLMALRS